LVCGGHLLSGTNHTNINGGSQPHTNANSDNTGPGLHLYNRQNTSMRRRMSTQFHMFFATCGRDERFLQLCLNQLDIFGLHLKLGFKFVQLTFVNFSSDHKDDF